VGHHERFKRERVIYRYMAKDDDDRMRIAVYPPLKNDLERLAKARGTTPGVLAKEILQLYVREEAYKKAQELLNIEDRVGTAVLLELQPEFEFLREDIIEMKEELLNLKRAVENLQKIPAPSPPKEEPKEKKVIWKNKEKEEEKKEEKKEEPKLRFPTFAGIDYEIRGDRVYYDDGSVWSIKLGAWLHRGRKIMEIKRKKDRELGR